MYQEGNKIESLAKTLALWSKLKSNHLKWMWLWRVEDFVIKSMM